MFLRCLVESDYFITSGELIFEASPEPMACISEISILPDLILENNETFHLLLRSSDPSVVINSISPQLTIQIEDSNSKSIMGENPLLIIETFLLKLFELASALQSMLGWNPLVLSQCV